MAWYWWLLLLVVAFAWFETRLLAVQGQLFRVMERLNELEDLQHERHLELVREVRRLPRVLSRFFKFSRSR